MNIDIRRETSPNIVGDARFLPIKSGSVDQVLFTDVIEHLPTGSEIAALREIERILAANGRVLVSTPNDVTLFKILDPEWYVRGHRHYSMAKILALLQESGLTPKRHFTSGFVSVMVSVVWYALFTFPLNRLLRTTLPEAPRFLLHREFLEYSFSRTNGYTIFVMAIKDKANNPPPLPWFAVEG